MNHPFEIEKDGMFLSKPTNIGPPVSDPPLEDLPQHHRFPATVPNAALDDVLVEARVLWM